MNCRSCGTALPQGVGYCPSCGTSTPYNTNSQPGSSPYDPTIAASYSGQQSQPGGTPATGYGSNPYGNYVQPQDPYNAPPSAYSMPGTPPTSNPYATPPMPSPATAYGTGNPPSYATPPGYGTGMPQGTPAGMQSGMQMGTFAPPVQQKKSNTGVLILIAVVVMVVVGGIVSIASIHNSSTQNSSNTTTATAQPSTGNPSGKTIVPAAASIITYAHTASKIDSNYDPTQITSAFKIKQDIYATFRINSHNQPGYIGAKWYADGQLVTSDSFPHSPQNDVGYFSTTYDTATNNGSVEVYWCTKSDCSDGQLAQMLKFTVSA